MTRLAITHGTATDVGLVREVNEDALLAEGALFAVVDGMGGHAGGDVASSVAVEELAALAHPVGVEDLLVALERAERRIAAYAEQLDGSAPPPGATLVAATLAQVDGEHAWLLVHLGDSRAYLAGPDGLRRLTHDHSVVQELVDAGQVAPEDAAGHPESHVVTRALGGALPSQPELTSVPARGGERLLLCSDGISDLVPDADLAAILAAHAVPSEAAVALVGAALAAGGRDNATAVVVDLHEVDR